MSARFQNTIRRVIRGNNSNKSEKRHWVAARSHENPEAATIVTKPRKTYKSDLVRNLDELRYTLMVFSQFQTEFYICVPVSERLDLQLLRWPFLCDSLGLSRQDPTPEQAIIIRLALADPVRAGRRYQPTPWNTPLGENELEI